MSITLFAFEGKAIQLHHWQNGKGGQRKDLGKKKTSTLTMLTLQKSFYILSV